MAWTAPRTWVTAEIPTASNFNTHLRDNLLETAPAIASAASQIFVSTAANAIAARTIKENITAASEATASTSYVNLTTTGPVITVTTGTQAVIFFGCAMSNSSASARTFMSYAVSSATTIAASDTRSLNIDKGDTGFTEFGNFYVAFSLTAGSNVFTGKYRVDAGTGTFARRRFIVFPL